MSRSRIRVDLHSHTRYSWDAWTAPAALVRRAAAAGLDRIAVTDHGRLEGARAAARVDAGRVIVGLEVHCREGVDLIGLFVHDVIPDGLPAADVAAAIHEQGGVVYAPHPFAYLRGAADRAALVLSVADVVEAFNTRAFLPMWNQRAGAAAAAAGLPAFASSDAHFPWEVGRAWTELPPFHDAASFLAAAQDARPHGHQHGSPFLHVGSMALSLARGHRIRL